jgi:hypothetical protein
MTMVSISPDSLTCLHAIVSVSSSPFSSPLLFPLPPLPYFCCRFKLIVVCAPHHHCFRLCLCRCHCHRCCHCRCFHCCYHCHQHRCIAVVALAFVLHYPFVLSSHQLLGCAFLPESAEFRQNSQNGFSKLPELSSFFCKNLNKMHTDCARTFKTGSFSAGT